MQRKSGARREITSRQAKDQKPVCTNNKIGPCPTSVMAMLEPSTLRVDVENGHTLSGSHSRRRRGFNDDDAVGEPRPPFETAVSSAGAAARTALLVDICPTPNPIN